MVECTRPGEKTKLKMGKGGGGGVKKEKLKKGCACKMKIERPRRAPISDILRTRVKVVITWRPVGEKTR